LFVAFVLVVIVMTTVLDDDDLGVVMAPAAMHPAIVMLGLNDDLGVLRLRRVRGWHRKAKGGNGAEGQNKFPHLKISSESRWREAGARNNPWQVRSVPKFAGKFIERIFRFQPKRVLSAAGSTFSDAKP
jgi:hypothetical protein